MITCTLPEGKNKVVYFDTEQSNYDVWRVVKRILNAAEISGNPLGFEAYGLRTLAPKDREFIIENYLYNNDDLGLVVIDGIRDLINDINSPEEATHISSKLLKWTEERNIHIITVLHQNKGDNNARGHIGAELTNKAETVISVEKNSEISIVKPEFVRGKDFEPFAFSVDGNGLPFIVQDWVAGNTKTSKKLTATQIDRETHIKVLKEVFSKESPKKYKELELDLKATFNTYGTKLTTSQLAEYIAHYRLHNLVSDTGGKGRLGNQYTLHESII